MNPLSIPSLPTDNLYKFYSISGITMILFTITVIFYFMKEIDDKSHSIQNTVQIIELESEFLSDDIDSYQKKIEELKVSVDKYQVEKDSSFNKMDSLDNLLSKLKNDSNYREYKEFYYNHIDKIIPEYKELIELDLISDKLIQSQREYKIKVANLYSNKEKVKSYLKYFNSLIFIGLILIVNGLYLSMKGFNLWQQKGQNLIDKKLEMELDLLKFELEKHKIEKEDKTAYNNS